MRQTTTIVGHKPVFHSVPDVGGHAQEFRRNQGFHPKLFELVEHEFSGVASWPIPQVRFRIRKPGSQREPVCGTAQTW